jgi:hypothetical protein
MGRSRHPAQFVVMASLVITSFATALIGQSSSRGVRPRSSAADYAASASAEGVTYAATQLSPDQVKHLFTSDISKSYLVFEIAVYPSSQANAAVQPDDFLIRTGPKGEYAHPADGVTVASVIQQKTTPRETHPPITSSGGVGVGIASGTDPVTGRRVRTVYSEADASVGAGGPPPYPSPPGSSPVDRGLLESQLMDRALPEGQFTVPVAGYLYFPASYVKKHSGNNYEMEYTTEGGRKVLIPVPVSK